MVLSLRWLLFSVALSLLVLAEADYPCDSAAQFLEEFPQCAFTDNSIFISSLFLNSIYSSFDDATKNFFIANGTLNGLDEDGQQACGAGIEEIRECVTERFQNCSSQLQTAADDAVDVYRGQFCEQSGGTWMYTALVKRYFGYIGQAFLQLFGDISSYDNTEGESSCISAIFQSDIWAENGTCLNKTLTTDVEKLMNESSFMEAKEELAGVFATYIKCIYQEVQSEGCGDDISVGFMAYLVLFSTPPGIDYGLVKFDTLVSTQQNPTGSDRKSVVVFGDPHIISYNGEEFLFSTCSAEGERDYLINAYVDIIGMNTAIEGWSGDTPPPTYMTQVTVIFKDTEGNAVATFEFSGGDSLPSTFTNGQADINGGSDGTDTNGASVAMASNGVTRLHFKRGGTVITIKKIGVTLAMTVRMEKSLYVGSTGDLVTGCPGSEIDTSGQAGRRKRGTVSDVCTTLALTGNYLTACEYDVDTTGDTTVVTGQYEGIQEMEEAAEELDETIIEEVTTTTQATASSLVAHVSTISVMLLGYKYIW